MHTGETDIELEMHVKYRRVYICGHVETGEYQCGALMSINFTPCHETDYRCSPMMVNSKCALGLEVGLQGSCKDQLASLST